MYYTYAIKSKEKNYIYVGLTNDPNRRIAEHNCKKEKTTRFYAPFQTILIEPYETRVEAKKREKYLKSGIGKEFLKSFVSILPEWRNLVDARDLKSLGA